MDEIVSEEQSAFVPGRLITDNVLVAFECFHAIKKKTHGSNGYCAVKLDTNKVYDRVEWGFLEAIMLKMGLHEHWVQLIMECVSSVSYLVRFNILRLMILRLLGACGRGTHYLHICLYYIQKAY